MNKLLILRDITMKLLLYHFCDRLTDLYNVFMCVCMCLVCVRKKAFAMMNAGEKQLIL